MPDKNSTPLTPWANRIMSLPNSIHLCESYEDLVGDLVALIRKNPQDAAKLIVYFMPSPAAIDTLFPRKETKL